MCSISIRLILLAFSCFNINGIIGANHRLDNRIVNSQDADVGQFPHMVSLQEYADKDHFCGGSIITDQYILTAAYCLQGGRADPTNIYAVVGSRRRQGNGTIMEISNIFTHSDYDAKTYQNDIALLQTTKRIEFTDIVKPISLPKTMISENSGLKVLVSGFGLIQEPNSVKNIVKPTFLQWIQTTVTSQDECMAQFEHLDEKYAKWLKDHKILDDKKVCTINPDKTGGCYGDNGNPLISKENDTLIGMLSIHIGCGRGFPDVYTNIYSYLGWIEETMTPIN